MTDLNTGEAWQDQLSQALDNRPQDPTAAPVERPKVVRLGYFRAVPFGTPLAVMEGAAVILRCAKLSIITGWCQRTPALDNVDHPVDPLCETASAWSINGAMRKAIPFGFDANSPADIAWRALQSVIWDDHEVTPETLNDRVARHVSTIVTAFDNAIALVEQRRRETE